MSVAVSLNVACTRTTEPPPPLSFLLMRRGGGNNVLQGQGRISRILSPRTFSFNLPTLFLSRPPQRTRGWSMRGATTSFAKRRGTEIRLEELNKVKVKRPMWHGDDAVFSWQRSVRASCIKSLARMMEKRIEGTEVGCIQ